jgi:VWFA-related protein
MQANLHPYRQTAGYGGEMAIDPASGTILRLAVEARLKPGSPVVQADILVEYGPVGIGGKIYFCPVKSVSVTTAEMVQVTDLYNQPLALQVQPLKTMLNDVKFEQYHVFRADARVLAADETAPDSSSPAQVPGAGPSNAGNVLTTASPAVETGPPAPVVAESPSTATTGPEPAVAEIGVTDAAGIPDVPASNRPATPVSGFTLRATTRLVDMGLVAYDKKGRPVTDLKRDDFEIYDNGRKQEIRYFAQGGQAAPPQATAASHQPVSAGEIPVYTNRPTREPVTSQPRSSAIEMHATILMIDAANLAWGDLSYAREEMLRFLKTLDAAEPVGLYILRSYGFQVLLEPSSDHALVAMRLNLWMPVAQDLARAQDEEQHNRQHIDWVAHTTDLVYVNGNDGTDPEGSASGRDRVALAKHGVDPQLRAMGSNPERDALLGLVTVARHLAVYPGHKSLVWISSDNALADWSGQAAGGEDKGSKFIDPLSLRAREALNESHISLYPLDASQLEATVITADLENRLIQAKLEEPAQPGASTPPPPPANPTGRNAALMHQDTHAIQGVFRDLAEATGGRALRRAGDIAAELNGIAEDGRAAYLLSFTPDSPADDKYHLLSVKLTNRRDLHLRYRTGYVFEKDPATIKERFERAVWQSRDMTEIAINATATQDSKDRALLLNIAATDLQMAETGDRWTDKLDIFLIERDDAAIHARVTGRTLGLRLRTATYQKVLRDGIPIGQPLPSAPKGGSMRVVVVDESSGRMGSVTIPAITLP